MIPNPSPTRRIAGRVLIGLAAAAALPLTASHAIAYVDVSQSPAVVPVAAPAPVAATIAATAAQPVPAAAPAPAVGRNAPGQIVNRAGLEPDDNMAISGDFVTIDGHKKRWEDLNAAEFARVRRAVAKARASLANTHIDRAQLERDVANVPDQARIAQLQRDITNAQTQASEALRRAQAEVAAGRDPDGLETAIAKRLQSLQGVDFAAASRALGSINQAKIAAEAAKAPEAIARARAELDTIQARIDADPRH